MISSSKSTNRSFVTIFCSLLFKHSIIILKDGETGCSILAAMRTETVKRVTTLETGTFQCPLSYRYLSNMCAAMKSVSFLYSFSLDKYIILYIPQQRSRFENKLIVFLPLKQLVLLAAALTNLGFYSLSKQLIMMLASSMDLILRYDV